MRYLLPVEGLGALEKQGDYEDAWLLLKKKWKQDKANSGLLIRLMTECWYILAFSDCVSMGEVSYDNVQKELCDSLAYGREHFNDVPRYLAIVGYMMNMLPYLFCSELGKINYEMNEQMGREMMQRAVQLDPTDLVAKVFYYGSSNMREESAIAREQLSHSLNELFSNETKMERYFANEYCICH